MHFPGGGGGPARPKILNNSMKLNWNFQRVGEGEGGGVQKKSLPWGRYGCFLELHIDRMKSYTKICMYTLHYIIKLVYTYSGLQAL